MEVSSAHVNKTEYHTGIVTHCQICNSFDLKTSLFLGYLPPVNAMPLTNAPLKEVDFYPTSLLQCQNYDLVQLGYIVHQSTLFPPEYPYTSGSTKILHDNFEDLADECEKYFSLSEHDLIVDIGSNDGTLLSKFKAKKCRVLGVEPTDVGDIALKAGIDTVKSFFNLTTAKEILKSHGTASIVTAANVFAHISDVNSIMEGINEVLDEKGVFVSESHYLQDFLELTQYDTIYHEHLRYYSLRSLQYLFNQHGFEIFNAKKIPTHGGSIRVYAARKGAYSIQERVFHLLSQEPSKENLTHALKEFSQKVSASKLELLSLLNRLKKEGATLCGISAPSRAATLISYVGLDDQIIDYIAEMPASLKIGKFMPGTRIPVVSETEVLFGHHQSDYALIFSWHIKDEIIKNLKKKGYKGKFIIPLPSPYIVD